MKEEREIEEMRERIVEELEDSESGGVAWHRLEAAETTLDWVLENNNILEAALEYRNR